MRHRRVHRDDEIEPSDDRRRVRPVLATPLAQVVLLERDHAVLAAAVGRLDDGMEHVPRNAAPLVVVVRKRVFRPRAAVPAHPDAGTDFTRLDEEFRGRRHVVRQRPEHRRQRHQRDRDLRLGHVLSFHDHAPVAHHVERRQQAADRRLGGQVGHGSPLGNHRGIAREMDRVAEALLGMQQHPLAVQIPGLAHPGRRAAEIPWRAVRVHAPARLETPPAFVPLALPQQHEAKPRLRLERHLLERGRRLLPAGTAREHERRPVLRLGVSVLVVHLHPAGIGHVDFPIAGLQRKRALVAGEAFRPAVEHEIDMAHAHPGEMVVPVVRQRRAVGCDSLVEPAEPVQHLAAVEPRAVIGDPEAQQVVDHLQRLVVGADFDQQRHTQFQHMRGVDGLLGEHATDQRVGLVDAAGDDRFVAEGGQRDRHLTSPHPHGMILARRRWYLCAQSSL